jgi:hypothetical protein
MIVGISVLLTYTLWFGWNFEFNKRQFGYVICFLLVLGMFIEAWMRETGDELLLAIALVVMIVLIILLGIQRRRRWKLPRGR